MKNLREMTNDALLQYCEELERNQEYFLSVTEVESKGLHEQIKDLEAKLKVAIDALEKLSDPVFGANGSRSNLTLWSCHNIAQRTLHQLTAKEEAKP